MVLILNMCVLQAYEAGGNIRGGGGGGGGGQEQVLTFGLQY